MARFNAQEADNYASNGGGGFFGLKNDGDQCRVRFMYNSIDDVEAYSVHRVPVEEGSKSYMYVNCLREYNDPVDACPFCSAHIPTRVKLFIPIYDEEAGTTKTWDRGKKFISKISSICNRFANDSLVSHTFTIERNGESGDKQTTYEIWEDGSDDTTMEDLPELPNVPVKEKSADDMEYYLQEGQFPPADDGHHEEAVRRRPTNSGGRETRSRRTPASSRAGKESF